jgi:hypothetical protein
MCELIMPGGTIECETFKKDLPIIPDWIVATYILKIFSIL